jgi:putative nucleotidyltransferase with HDIG domain
VLNTDASNLETRPRVLVIDDEPSFVDTISDLLGESGFDVSRACDPSDALRRASAGSFDAALVDLVMPGMSGLELIERLHEVSPFTQVAVVTGHATMETALSSLQRGVYDYLPKKDITAPSLEGMVRGAVERARLRRAQVETQEQMRDSNELLGALHTLGAAALRASTVERLLEDVSTIARNLVDGTSARALLVTRTHSEDGILVSASAGERAREIRGARLDPEEGLAVVTALTGKTFLLERADDHPRYSHKTDEMPKPHLGFLSVPLRYGSIQGALLVSGWRQRPFTGKALDSLGQLGRQAAVHLETLAAKESAANFFTHTCDLLVSILDAVDVHAPGHSRATAAYADMITRRLGMADAERRNVHFAALLHDIGKVKMDLDLVRESGLYDDETRERMKRHPIVAVEMLKPITAWGEMLPIIHAHHERWDGQGYPTGLKGEDIPLGARVVAVAEAFDSMIRSKPYGRPRPPEEALAELGRNAGTQFDPKIVRLFVSEYRRQQAGETDDWRG